MKVLNIFRKKKANQEEWKGAHIVIKQKTFGTQIFINGQRIPRVHSISLNASCDDLDKPLINLQIKPSDIVLDGIGFHKEYRTQEELNSLYKEVMDEMKDLEREEE